MLQSIGAIAAGILAVLLLMVVVASLAVGSFFLDNAWRRFTAPIRGETEAIETIQSGEFRIQAYQHFFSLCTEVQTDEARIDQFSEELVLYSPGTRDHSRVQANLTAAVIARSQAVNTYNNDANKNWTEGQFRDNDLPFYIRPEYAVGGEHTVCG